MPDCQAGNPRALSQRRLRVTSPNRYSAYPLVSGVTCGGHRPLVTASIRMKEEKRRGITLEGKNDLVHCFCGLVTSG